MDKTNHLRQQKLSFAQFLAELPNFLVLTVSVILTGSLIVWMDFLDSLGNVLRTGTVAALSKHLSRDLRYKYNYGVSKIENIAVLFCDGIVMCGLIIAAALSVHEIIHPQRPSDLLIYVDAIKIINVTLDAFFLREQRKIRKTDSSVLAQSNYAAAKGMLLFDAVGLFSILLIWICKNSIWTWYFSPIISILIAVYLGYKCVKRLGKSISELIDRTLPEEEQMKILKILTRHYVQYAEFHFVNSHNLGGKAQIDIILSFSDETTYPEIVQLKETLQNEISAAINDSVVNIIIT